MGRRILMLAGWYFPDFLGGTETYVHLLSKQLQALGWEVLIAAPSVDEKQAHYIHDGLEVFRYPVTLKPTKAEIRGKVIPEYFAIFKNWLIKNKPDIVHMHSYTRGCGFYHAQCIKELKIPLVLTLHTMELICLRGEMMHWGSFPCDGKVEELKCLSCYLQKRWHLFPLFAKVIALVDWDLRRWFKLREAQVEKLFNFADRVVVVSKWLYELMAKEKFSAKVSLSLHGVPADFADEKIPADFKCPKVLRFGFIGRFNYVKGAHIIIKAIKRLPKDLTVELKLYGRTNTAEEKRYLEYLKRLAKDDKRIVFLGEVEEKNRKEVFDSFDILLVPSLWFETGPYVVLEAFSAKKPVIGSRLGGIKDLVTDKVNGLLVEPVDISAWERTIKWAAENPSVIKDWVQNIPYVRTTKEVLEDMLKIYNAL